MTKDSTIYECCLFVQKGTNKTSNFIRFGLWFD